MLNRFDDFFKDPTYLDLKNHLFNYQERVRSIQEVAGECSGIRLEIGSGISPVTTASIYTDLSHHAMKFFKEIAAEGLTPENIHANGETKFAVTDARYLSFQNNSIDQVVLSEVLEHIQQDDQVLAEIFSALKPGGSLILTVPTQPKYYAYDDEFVYHERRYDIRELTHQVERVGFKIVKKKKIGGPLEKLGTWLTVKLFVGVFDKKQDSNQPPSSERFKKFLPFYKAINRFLSSLIRFDAWLMPECFTSIILLECKK